MSDSRRRSSSRSGGNRRRDSPHRNDDRYLDRYRDRDRDHERYHPHNDAFRSRPRSRSGYRDRDPETSGHREYRDRQEYQSYRNSGRADRYGHFNDGDSRDHGDSRTLQYDDDVGDGWQPSGRASRWDRDRASREASPDHLLYGDGFSGEQGRDNSPYRRRSRELRPGGRNTGHCGSVSRRGRVSREERSSLSGSEDRSRSRGHGSSRSGSRSRSRLRNQTRIRPSYVVVLERIPPDATDSDITHGLDAVSDDSRLVTEQIKRVLLRSGRRGYQIAFIEFFDLADAKAFIRHYQPAITFQLSSRGKESELVTMDVTPVLLRDEQGPIYPDLDSRFRHGWICFECDKLNHPYNDQCYSCLAMREISPFLTQDITLNAPFGPVLTGDTDECPQQVPSQYLLIRGLRQSVDEGILAKHLRGLYLESAPVPTPKPVQTNEKPKLKSTAPTKSTVGLGARPSSLRRVFLARDSYRNVSWKYGFAEFETLQDAQGAVAKFRSMDKFTIDSKPVVVAFIHTGVFVPAPDQSDTSRFTFSPIYNRNLRLKYWDDRVYLSAFVVQTDPVPAPEITSERPTREKSNAPGAVRSATTAKPVSAPLPPLASSKSSKNSVAMLPQMKLWAKKRTELLEVASTDATVGQEPTRRQRGSLKTQYGHRTPPARPHHVALPPKEERDPNGQRSPNYRDEIISYGWKTTTGKYRCALCLGDLQFDTHKELIDHEVLDASHQTKILDEKRITAADLLLREQGEEPTKVVRRNIRRRCDPASEYTSYADHKRLICLVCDPPRQFQSKEVLRLHETESKMHQQSLANEGNVALARRRLEELGLSVTAMRPRIDAGPISDYRDRASERRAVFQQPAKPLPPRTNTAARRIPAKTPTNAPVTTQKPGLGEAMLHKMGWTPGKGLGAYGEGRTEGVETNAYVPGAGLGVEGGRIGDAAEEAARRTKSDGSGFIEKTRAVARERFEKME